MQQQYNEEILLCILRVGSKMDAIQIIQRFGNRVLDQISFIYLIKAMNDKIPQSEIEKFYQQTLIQFQAQAITSFILNELLRKASQIYAQKQGSIAQKTPEDIFHLIQKSIKAKNQEIEKVFRIFDMDRDCMLNEQEFKYFVEYYVPTILPEEFKKLKLTYPSKNVTLYELMTWMQETSAMRNSIKVFEKAKQPAKVIKKPQEQQPQKVQTLDSHPIPNKQPPNISKQNTQNTNPVPQRQINPVLESILYEDPNQANILKSEIQFQNYVILDYNLPGVQDFLKIFNDLYRKQQPYTDFEFQANAQSLGRKLQQYQWKRLNLIWPDYDVFVKDVTQSRFGLGKWISPKDIRQGELGDCYFLSTLSSMACRWPDFLLDLFLTQKRNPCGIYSVRLCIDGIWKAIILDDFIPIKYDKPAFSQSQSKEIWVILMEKAWAKCFGSYSNIISGESREVMRTLTGGPTWSLRMDQKDFKEQFTGCIARKCLMTTGTQSADKNQQIMGLIPDHAYSILKIRKIKHPTKGEVTLVKLRNPWGKKEWNGEWSDDSKSWTQEIKTQLRVSEKSEDGIFYMSYEDFVNYFCTVYVGYFKKNYIYTSLQVISKVRKSLYFTFDIVEAGEYYLSAIQQSSRHFKEKYTNYENSPIRMILGYQSKQGYEFEEGKQETDQEVYVGGLLEKGKYFIQVKVKWLFWNEHNFTISSYGEKQVKIRQIQKNPDLLHQIMIHRAKQNNQQKPLSKDCSTIMTCSEMNPSIGIGYEYYKNNGNQTLDLTCQYLKMQGLKLKKPERGNGYQIKLEPGKEKIVLVTIDPKGFSQQQQRSYILK